MTIKIGVHFPHVHKLVTPYLDAFCAGMKRHDVKLEICSFPEHLVCDVAVCWNHRNKKLFDLQKRSGGHYLVMERGFIGDRTRWTSIGYDGLNGRADFVVKGMPGDRFKRHFSRLMQPWKQGGRYVLVNAQCQGDASVTPYVNFKKWAFKTVEKCHARFPGKEVIWRPHPVEVERACAYDVPGARTSTGKTLAEDMAGACAVITFNSNSGVDAAMAGVPTFALDEGSMARPVAAHNLDDDPIRPNRRHWAWDLAYKQWTMEDLTAGVPWSYLKEKVV